MRVVLDTSVLLAAMRSARGASYALVHSIPAPEFQLCLSLALYHEWQAVLTRQEHLTPGSKAEDVRRFLRYLASQSHLQEIYFLWRPFLPDPDDDFVVAYEVAAGPIVKWFQEQAIWHEVTPQERAFFLTPTWTR